MRVTAAQEELWWLESNLFLAREALHFCKEANVPPYERNLEMVEIHRRFREARQERVTLASAHPVEPRQKIPVQQLLFPPSLAVVPRARKRKK